MPELWDCPSCTAKPYILSPGLPFFPGWISIAFRVWDCSDIIGFFYDGLHILAVHSHFVDVSHECIILLGRMLGFDPIHESVNLLF
jgi:hypothetical protein